jgi:hypothetical protein
MVRTSFAGRNFCYHHTIKPRCRKAGQESSFLFVAGAV